MAIKIKKLSDEQNLILCRRYFLCGFAFLPLLWLVNLIWFYRYSSCGGRRDSQPTNEENMSESAKKIKCYVFWSGIGVIIWSVLITGWVIFYQLNRRTGDVKWAEALTYIYPLGYV